MAIFVLKRNEDDVSLIDAVRAETKSIETLGAHVSAARAAFDKQCGSAVEMLTQ